MNPLTLVKQIQSINSKELDIGISDEASCHANYKDSAYVSVGGLPYGLTEGDLLAIFAQYGEVVDVNLVRDKGTGKSNGANVLGRIIKVEHCSEYSKREEEDEETKQKKREARGVCRAFQRKECTRGDSCKFSHNENVNKQNHLQIHNTLIKLFFFSLILYMDRELRIPVGVTKIIEVPGEIRVKITMT